MRNNMQMPVPAADDLMMEALDGTLDADGWSALRQRLAQRPDERAAFERLVRTDAALKAEPLAAAPLTGRVMSAVVTADAHKALSAAQAAFLVAAGSLVMMAGGLAAAAALGLFALDAPPAAWQAVIALGAQVLAFVRQVIEIAGGVLRAVYSQPAAWALVLALWIVAGAWASAAALAWSRRFGDHGSGFSAFS